MTIDEILASVAISLGEISLSACPNGDRDGDGAVTIDEILTAVYAALTRCAPDLVPISVRQLPCPGGCAPLTIEVCVRNDGPLGAGIFGIGVNGVTVGWIDDLPPIALHCAVVPYVNAASGDAMAEADPENLVDEILESNNRITFPAPNPTACDVICDP